jgi:hypothetical protein
MSTKWICRLWHSWEYIEEHVEFIIDSNGRPVAFFHEVSENIVKQFNIKPNYLSCVMRVCRRCSKKQIYSKRKTTAGLENLIHNSIFPSLQKKKTWQDFNHLTLQQIREKKLKSLGFL